MPHGPDRLVGIDMARALAFGGMLLAHFAGSRRHEDPGWLQALDATADGRAAPLFCLLLGLGAGILSARGASDGVLVRRGFVLFGLGAAVWPYVDRVFLILPQYGVLLALFPLLRRVPTRWLVPSAALAFVLPSAIVSVVAGHGLRGADQPSSYGELVDVPHLVGYLFWTGAYPVVGWVGFVLVGIWVGRLPLQDPRTQHRLVAGGLAVALTQPILAVAFEALGGGAEPAQAAGLAAFFDGSAHSNQTAWYALASATAVAVVAVSLALARRSGAWSLPLVRLGQLALSAYLGHILLGDLVVWGWVDTTTPPLTRQVLVVGLVFAAFAAAATAWRARFRRGPLEAAVRVLSG